MWDCRELGDRCGTAGSWIRVGLQGVGKVWMELDRCGTAELERCGCSHICRHVAFPTETALDSQRVNCGSSSDSSCKPLLLPVHVQQQHLTSCQLEHFLHVTVFSVQDT